MSTLSPTLSNRSARSEWVRLRTLVMLRWLAIIGQIGAVFVSVQMVDLDLPLGLCALAIGASVILNVYSAAALPLNKRLTERETLLMLTFDLCQLVFLLYLTGGINNPFTLLILAPVTISATALSLNATISLGIIAIAFITMLTVSNVPLATTGGEQFELPVLFQWGNWIAMTIGVLFLSAYARRVSVETFSMSQALAATQMALEREQKLSMLGGVVAAAAHEMGTPLATIKLVSSEMQEDLQTSPELLEDAKLIHSQADRLSTILKEMGRSGKDDLLLKTAPLESVVKEASEPHEDRGIKINYLYNGNPSLVVPMPTITRQPEVIHGLRNLVQNAVDFAAEQVWINMVWTESTVSIFVGDDGKGYASDLLNRIGDPYVSSGPKRRSGERGEYEGMGLGLFIAKTLLERAKAVLSFANGSPQTVGSLGPAWLEHMTQANGAIVCVEWARDDLQATTQALGQNQTINVL